ncbi:MAG: hypothetical protein KKA19_04035 [Candidatus Margulisbacteria bacterium]|nr:hypothetical protein [Candidatus Margulisiibacteriota bacterium]
MGLLNVEMILRSLNLQPKSVVEEKLRELETGKNNIDHRYSQAMKESERLLKIFEDNI